MPEPTISVDEYVNDRKMSANEDGVVFKAASAPRTYDAEKRSCQFVMSSQDIDRDMDIVVTRGIDLTDFEKNPIALMNHRSDMPLGRWEDVAKKPKRLEGTAVLADEGTAPHVDMMAGMLGQGIVRASSIGFRPRTLKRREMENGEFVRGYIIEECALFECSIVSIPANAQALAKQAAAGNAMAKELIEYTLDTWCKNAEGLIVPRADFEVAHAEATGNKETVIQTVKLQLDDTDIKAAIDKAIEDAKASIPAPTGKTDSKAAEGDIEPKSEKQPKAQQLEVTEGGILNALKGLLGINDPEPPAKADPERVKALAERAKAIREAQEAA